VKGYIRFVMGVLGSVRENKFRKKKASWGLYLLLPCCGMGFAAEGCVDVVVKLFPSDDVVQYGGSRKLCAC